MSRAYAGLHTEESQTVELLYRLPQYRTVKEVSIIRCFRSLTNNVSQLFAGSGHTHSEIAMNLIVADTEGHIG